MPADISPRFAAPTESESVEYVWDNNVVLHEVTRSTADGDRRVVTWEHEPFGFTPLARFSGREADVAICDHLGRPVHLVSRDGAVTWSTRSSPWGVSSALGVDPWRCPIRRPGEWADRETGLVYNRHRYYAPALARYMSPDPIGMAGGLDMVGYSPNPVAWIDPLGLGVICPQKAQQIADEFEKQFGKKPD